MTEGDFTTIEHSLGVILPAAYRRLMSAYPFGDDRPSDAYLPDNAAYICRLNQHIRDERVCEKLWRTELLAIGTSLGGDVFALDTSLADSPVLRFSQDHQTVHSVAATLDEWVGTLKQWYIDFDAGQASLEYKLLSSAVREAGFFITSPEPMDGWHRVCVSSKKGGGKSFWVARIQNNWFAGTWGGNVYRVPGDISDFCTSWLGMIPIGSPSDFSKEIKTQFDLQSVTEDEFDDLTRAS